MSAGQLLVELNRNGLRLEANGDQLRVTPWSAVTSEMKDQIKLHKVELLEILNAEPPTYDDRMEAYRGMVKRINKAYQGTPVDWQYLDQLTDLMMQAETQTDLMQAIAEYENVALCQYPLDFKSVD